MKISLSVFMVLSFFCFSCVETQQLTDKFPPPQLESTEAVEPPGQSSYWLSYPDNGDLVIWGVANRQGKRDDEIKLALDDAARKVALFYGVKGKITTTTTNGSGLWAYSMDIATEFGYDTEYKKYIEALKYEENQDVLSIDGALLLRVHYTLQNPLNVPFNSDVQGEKPEWIRKRPDIINGYMAGVGFARPQGRFKETVSKAYEDAIISIIKRISVKTSTRIITLGDGSTLVVEEEISEGELQDFFVLEMWHDRATNGVHVLAVAKKK
ncbi:hypothetical protein FACS1894137_02300 [Spirochaetia bacterium]|nr:hypothetical protein FACS1894137_02300 [Spirochaetia bacterium]